LKWLSLGDEYTRECPTLLCSRSITAQDVIDELIRLMKTRGMPAHIRSDNEPEFMAKAIHTWLQKAGVGTLFVESGAPWENGYAESFHARLRDEFLKAELFSNLQEAKALGEQWRWEYNHERPHSSLGSLTPSEFAAGRLPSSVVLGAALSFRTIKGGQTPSRSGTGWWRRSPRSSFSRPRRTMWLRSLTLSATKDSC